MALLTAQPITVAGLVPTLTAANAGGDTTSPGPGVILVVNNGDATSKTVTLVTPGTLPTGDAYPDKAYTVTAGSRMHIPVLPLYADPTTQLASITYSAVTSVTVGVISI